MALTPEEKLERRYPLAKQMVENGTASPRVQRAVELLLAGHGLKEIGSLMGVSTSSAADYLVDPTGEKADRRRHKRFGICQDCGAKTFNGGSVLTPKRCQSCAKEHTTEQARARVLIAIRDWHNRYGEVPGAMDWNVSMARNYAHPERLAQILARHRDRDWPTSSGVQPLFGTWNNAIEAAGFEPLAPGKRRDPEKWQEHIHNARRNAVPIVKAEEMIAREVERNQARIEKLESDLKELREEREKLSQAHAVLNGNGSVPAAV